MKLCKARGIWKALVTSTQFSSALGLASERPRLAHSTFEKEIDAGSIVLIGHEAMARKQTKWLVRSSYALCGSI